MLIAYEQEFRRLRETRQTVLEIGVKKGGSLNTWADWFAHAPIVGVDINPVRHAGPPGRVAVIQGDQGDVALLAALARDHGPFAIVIDDGSHHSRHQRVGFETLFPHVVPGGLYVIEDIHAGYKPGFTEPGERAAVSYVAGLMPYLCVSERDPEHPTAAFLRQRTASERACGQAIAKITVARRTAIIEKQAPLTGPPWTTLARLAARQERGCQPETA